MNHSIFQLSNSSGRGFPFRLFRAVVVQRPLSNGKRSNKYQQTENPIETVRFSHLLRQFYKKAHPDILRGSHPVQADVNDTSFQLLNGILSTIKEDNGYPPRMMRTIPFHLMEKNGIVVRELHIKTAGGDCKKQLRKTFEAFFQETGISKGQFTWDKEYFPGSSS